MACMMLYRVDTNSYIMILQIGLDFLLSFFISRKLGFFY
jgi:hypothetical protein